MSDITCIAFENEPFATFLNHYCPVAISKIMLQAVVNKSIVLKSDLFAGSLREGI